MKEYAGEFLNGKFRLPPLLAEDRRQYLASRKAGTRATETFAEESKNKSHKQVKTVFGLIVATVKRHCDEHGWDSSMFLKLDKPTGTSPSEGLIKEYFYATCPIFADDGQRITLSNPKCTMAKAAKFIDETMAISASELSIYIPEPNPAWKEEVSQ
jgi:hypothetical protein